LFNGASSLFAFGLGTLPVMLGFGSLATVISHKTTNKILKVSAIIVLVLGLIMLNRGLTVMGSPVSYDAIKEKIIEPETGAVIMKGDYQEINMEVNRYGWEPNSFVLKKGVPVKWNINVKELTGCNNEIIVRDYDIDIKLKQGLNVVEFTPDKTGTVRWSCWMGMIPGSFIVTDDGTATEQEISASAPSGGGSCGGSCGSASCGAATGGGCGCGG
jgi:plastocyanin domain-containing protein